MFDHRAAGESRCETITFAGNEIDRVQVYAFSMHMQALAAVSGGSVTILSHPSLQGIASGSGLSGSTAWHGAFRFRQYLKSVKSSDGEQPDNDLRELQFLKNQYGPKGESIVLRYQRGLFLPELSGDSFDKLARAQLSDDIFMQLLKRFARDGRHVNDKSGKSFAPAIFAEEGEARNVKLRKAELEDSMRRLFANEKIRLETYGKPSNPHTKLVALDD